MTAPFGLTRAEEDRERQTAEPRVAIVAPSGSQRCRISVPPKGDDCPAAATCVVVWPGREDNGSTPACAECAARTTMLAESHHTSVRIRPLGDRR